MGQTAAVLLTRPRSLVVVGLGLGLVLGGCGGDDSDGEAASTTSAAATSAAESSSAATPSDEVDATAELPDGAPSPSTLVVCQAGFLLPQQLQAEDEAGFSATVDEVEEAAGDPATDPAVVPAAEALVSAFRAEDVDGVFAGIEAIQQDCSVALGTDGSGG